MKGEGGGGWCDRARVIFQVDEECLVRFEPSRVLEAFIICVDPFLCGRIVLEGEGKGRS